MNSITLPQAKQVTTIASVVRGLLEILTEDGHDTKRVAANFDINLDDINTPNKPLSYEKVNALWELAYQTRGELLGLDVGSRLQLLDIQDVGLFLTSLNNVQDWLEQIKRYLSLISDSITIDLEVVGGELHVAISHKFLMPHHELRHEAIALMGKTLLEQYLNKPVRMSRIELLRTAPADATPWELAFECPIVWNAAQTKCVVDIVHTMQPINTRNEDIRKGYQIMLDSRLQRARNEFTATDIRRELIGQLMDHEPTLSSVAESLHKSPRTVQRTLSHENLSFSDLLTEVRMDLGKQYLRIGHPIARVASLLHYSNDTAFLRAFKRETKQTPSEFVDNQSEN